MIFPNGRHAGPPRAGEPTGIALWRQVADGLERAIAAGTYGVGTKLPGEKDIASLFGVNRHTVRRALAELSERGLVRAMRGSGTFVEAQRIAYPIRPRTRFSEIIGTSGREAGGRLIAKATEPAQAEIAHRLAVRTGSTVVRLELLRQADRVPVCVATTWLSAARFPDAARVYAAKRSITSVLAHFGVADYRRASTRVIGTLAEAGDAMRLALAPGSPILLVDSVDVDLRGQPLLVTRARFAAERVEFVVES
ncbi:MAG: phosphonate metabolism transcriptional regulator PhnF [Rhizobiales bacterium]|nr:phosphonate metabolism transcriptional regulator PhnF [Hyphomicrobiales bacterium]